MEQDSTNLEVVTGFLQSEAKKELKHPRNELIWAALYSEDKNWYRVKLMDC